MGLKKRSPGKIKYRDVEHTYQDEKHVAQKCKENPKPGQ